MLDLEGSGIVMLYNANCGRERGTHEKQIFHFFYQILLNKR